MTKLKQLVIAFASVVLVGSTAAPSSADASASQDDASAKALIGVVTTHVGEQFTIPCGETEEDRRAKAAADALVRMGNSAVPDLDLALDRAEMLDRRGADTANVRLLLQAYVRIKGISAYPRLQQMVDHAGRVQFQLAIDYSIAQMFHITSFVSFRAGQTVMREYSIGTCRAIEPRDGLDRFLLGWEANDRLRVRASLASSGRADLGALLQKEPWDILRARLWQGPSDRASIGYRFTTQPGFVRNPGMETILVNAEGSECGRIRVRFAGIPIILGTDGPVDYFVDNSDITSLLRVVSTCAAYPNAGH